MQLGSINVVGSGLNSFQLNQYTLTIDYNGLLNINISNISNPNLYNGSRLWTVSCTDNLLNKIAAGVVNQSS
jgi:hypothetical protein